MAEEVVKQEVKKEGRMRVALGMDKKSVVVKDGRKIQLGPLRLTELADLEDFLGKPIAEAFQGSGESGLSIKMLIYIFWLSCRRHGLTSDEIDAEKWKLSVREVGDWFDFGDLEVLMGLMEMIFEMSGLEISLKNVSSQSGQKTLLSEKQ